MGTFIGGAAVGGTVGGALGLSVYCCGGGIAVTESGRLVEKAVRTVTLCTSPSIGSAAGGVAAEVMCSGHRTINGKKVSDANLTVF